MSKKSTSSIFTGMGASTHSDKERAKNDFYVTDPIAIDLLHKHGLLDPTDHFWECACGDGSLSKQLEYHNYTVDKSTDLYDLGYGESGVDFLKETSPFHGSIITNPPFKLLNDFIIHGLELAENKLYIFARIQTIESKIRYESIFKDNPPAYICPFVKRVTCYAMGKPYEYKSAICYAWFIWDQKSNDECKVRWLI